MIFVFLDFAIFDESMEWNDFIWIGLILFVEIVWSYSYGTGSIL